MHLNENHPCAEFSASKVIQNENWKNLNAHVAVASCYVFECVLKIIKFLCKQA